MAIRNLLVAFNGAPTSEVALQAALAMQAKYGAHLTGILARDGARDSYASHPLVPDNVRTIVEKAVADETGRIEARFREAVAGRAPEDRVHWISLTGEPDATVAQYACMFDVTIVGAHTVGDAAESGLHPERIALKSGRPVLLVPAGPLDPETINRRAVLAWDGRRAATRALTDAMQILETKQEVHVLSVGDDIRPPLRGIDVVTALARHGVTAERIRRPQATRNPGREILDYCREVEAGLLVMGAYEHSVFREELFGGATSHVLRHAHIPVLMSH